MAIYLLLFFLDKNKKKTTPFYFAQKKKNFGPCESMNLFCFVCPPPFLKYSNKMYYFRFCSHRCFVILNIEKIEYFFSHIE